ncbi:helix-turn-helix domain-containing protein [Rhizobium sullae]|uniref:helix-turn-helix domain-containing protein n=1 Tax=Rhizobium sullae TaxID=50338 RepID=UPI000B359F55|nr:helix-turn-helix domain-containing protein [Rhizobium sullae]
MMRDDALNQIEQLLAEQKRMAERLDHVERKLDRQLGERAGAQSIDQTDTVSMLRMACAERGVIVTADGRVGENDAAALLGKASQTLRNWRAGARPLPFSKIGGTVTYHLQDLAELLDGGKSDA